MRHSENAATHRADQSFIRSSMASPLLSREREQALAIAWREEGDERALHGLVQAYGRLVVAMASRYRRYGLPLADLIQEGSVGLMTAALRFDPAREVRFSTYAAWWIRSCLQEYVLRNWSIVRTGVNASHKLLFFNLRRLQGKISRMTGEENLTDAARVRIAGDLGVPLRDVEMMECRMTHHDQSLNAPVGHGDRPEDRKGEWQERLVDEGLTPEEAVVLRHDRRQRAKWLYDALGTLNPRERTVICGRRLGDEGVTLETLGRRLGVSKERVRQLEARAMAKLRTALMRRASTFDLLEEKGRG